MTKHMLFAVTTALLSASALAQTPPEGGRPGGGGAGWLMQADTNGDGVISWEEAQAAATARFAKMDANHDGVLSGDEMPAFGRRGGGAGAPDKQTLAQFLERSKQRFDRLDTNHDGKLDPSELQAARDRMMGMRGN